jgi:hypothetical protein
MEENLVWVVGLGVLMIGIVTWGAVVGVTNVSRERTKREIMAYVAEGAISPQDAAHLIEISEQAEIRKKIISDASWSGNNDNYRKTLDRVLGKGDAQGGEPNTA